MQNELVEIKADVKQVTVRLDGQDKLLARIDGKLDGIIATQKTTDKHPITKVTTQVETDGQTATFQQGIVSKVLRYPSLPWVICMACILSMALLCFAALTGRKASDFIPARAATPATP